MRVCFISFIFYLILSSVCLANQVENVKVKGNNVDTHGVSTAIDSFGNQGICFRDLDEAALSFAYFDGNDWNVEVVDNDNGSGKKVGDLCAVIFDHQDNPHIVYYQTTDQEIRHAHKNGVNWQINLIDDQIKRDLFLGLYIQDYHRLSLAIDGQGILATVYYDALNDDLIYAQWDGNDWQKETIVEIENVGQYATLDFDDNDNPGVVYVKDLGVNGQELYYVYHDGNDWNLAERIDAGAKLNRYASLKFDVNNVPHVVFQSVGNDNYNYLKYTNKIGGEWNQSIILTHGASIGNHCQLSLSNKGNAHVIYREYFMSALFPDINYIQMINMYFVDRLKPFQANVSIDRITFSTAPLLKDYESLSVVASDEGDVVYSYIAQNAGNNQFSLNAGQIMQFTPKILLMSPNANNRLSQNDEFRFSWATFEAENNSQISFYYWDENFNEIAFGDVYDIEGKDSVVVDVSGLPVGEHTVFVKMSSDGFNTSYITRGLVNLVVPQRQNQNNPNNQQPQNEQNNNNELPQIKNRPPSKPKPLLPGNNQGQNEEEENEEGKIRFKIENSSDEDGDLIEYVFQVCIDKECQNPIYEKAGVEDDGSGETLLEISGNEIGQGNFYWRVKAVDENNESSDWSTPVMFSIDDGAQEEVESKEEGGDVNSEGSAMSAAASGCSLIVETKSQKNVSVKIYFLLILILVWCRKRVFFSHNS